MREHGGGQAFMANAEVPRTMSAALRDIAGMGERDVNAALAAANPTQQLSPRELVDMIRTWKARAEAAEALARRLAVMLRACLEENADGQVPWRTIRAVELLLREPAVVALLKEGT